MSDIPQNPIGNGSNTPQNTPINASENIPFNTEENTSQNPPENAPAGWDYKVLICAYLFSVFLQMMFLPCLCHIGEAKMEFAFLFDGFVLLRIIVAKIINEKNKGWQFYAILMLTSIVWIEVLVGIIAGTTHS